VTTNDTLSYAVWLAEQGIAPRAHRPPIWWARHRLFPIVGIVGAEGQATQEQLGQLLDVSSRTVLRIEHGQLEQRFPSLWRYAIAGLLLELGGAITGSALSWTWLEQTTTRTLSRKGNPPNAS